MHLDDHGGVRPIRVQPGEEQNQVGAKLRRCEVGQVGLAHAHLGEWGHGRMQGVAQKLGGQARSVAKQIDEALVQERRHASTL